MKTIFTVLIILISSTMLASCASNGFGSDESQTPGANSTSGTPGGTDTFPAGGNTSVYPYDRSGNISGQPGGGYGSPGGGRGPAGAGSDRVVYFDYDSAEIRPEYKPVVEANARYLAANPSTSVVLEGNTDERGTREYNIGLGERRAETVRRLMSAYNVSPNQMRTLSYGEERPAVQGHDESSYAMNRRVEIAY